MSFSDDMKKICKKTGDDAGKVGRNIKIKLFSEVSNNTTVKTGRLRGNWQTSTGKPKYGEMDRTDKTGSAVLQEINSNVTAFGVDYFTNNLPYATVEEERKGFVAKSMANINRSIKEAVKDVRG
jgi:hypothetical protein